MGSAPSDIDTHDITRDRYKALATITLQNTIHVLLLRYSRTSGKSTYLSSTAVLLTEVVKVLISILIIAKHKNFHAKEIYFFIREQIFGNWSDTLKLSVPSITYTIQNNLLFLALSHLDAATFQVAYQTRIIAAALFSKYILRKDIGSVRWIALFILALGVAIVQLPNSTTKSVASDSSLQMVGITAVMISCLLSGFSGVYLEKIMKSTPATTNSEREPKNSSDIQSLSIWIRNIQMGLFGCIFGVIGILALDFQTVYQQGFFRGYSMLTIAVIAVGAIGGLLVSVALKYADNISKGFATSLSIPLSSLLSLFLFNTPLRWNFFVGACMVMISVYIYSVNEIPSVVKQAVSSVRKHWNNSSSQSTSVIEPHAKSPDSINPAC